MKRKSVIWLSVTGLVLAGFVLACRACTSLADFYAVSLYPVISSCLSLISSAIPFSLNDAAIGAFVVGAIIIAIGCIRHKSGWGRFLLREALLGLWIFVWCYMGWGVNYYRSDIFARAGMQRQAYDREQFVGFLNRYTQNLNDAFSQRSEIAGDDILEAEVKHYYEAVGPEYGLCKPRRWQHSKPMMLNALQSAVGVTGYMGPFFDEFHVNKDTPDGCYPFTFAHEYAHLMGVSSEAEANWWAFDACRKSSDAAIRYSAYYSILAHVWNNAAGLLEEAEFGEWIRSIQPGVLLEFNDDSNFWKSKRIPLLDEAQTRIYNLFLKGNRIPSGIRNYSEVIQIILAFEDC